MSSRAGLDPSTAVVALGRPARAEGAALNPPIAMSSTFAGSGSPQPGRHMYARMSNEAWEPLEEALGELEGSPLPALAYASGMAAVAAVFSLVPAGGVAVVPSAAYNGTVSLARRLDAEGRLILREVDPTDAEATALALEGADLLWLESPSNPLLEIVDLLELCAAARARGVAVAVDNTFSTPLRQRPFESGADIVVHSATKFIAGHSDVLLGLVLAADPELRARLHVQRTLHGAIPGPFEAWLALRGLRTLALRLDRAESSAAELARRLSERPELSRVHYPGLPGDPGHQLASEQLRAAGVDPSRDRGYGAIVSIEFAGGKARADAFVRALELITPATSLGGVESLAERRRRQPSEPEAVPETLVRLSIGIEHVEDLWADIAQALER